VLQALESAPADLFARAEAIAGRLSELGAVPVRTAAAVGGGGAPEVDLPSAAVALPTRMARPLRLGDPSVVGHVERGRLLLDLVAVPPSEDDTLVEAVRRAAGTVASREEPPCT
jgi:L-seryl-tRNA(Ser) seleniumtransferase